MLRNILLIVPLVLVVSFYFLRQGITIDSFKIGGYQVEGLYLKLDKKLIVGVRHLVIPRSKKKVDFSQLETVLDRIKLLPNFFRYIQLDRVDFTDNHYRIIYRDKAIYLSSDAYEVAGMIERKGNMIEAQIPMLHIKKYGMRLNGLLHYDYRQDIVQMEGNYTVAGLSGTLNVIRKGEHAHFRLKSGTFASLKPLVELLDADAPTREWLTRRIQARSYRIRSLKGDILIRGDGITLDTMHLQGKAELKQARVRFDDALKRVEIPSAELELKQNVLYMVPHRARYAGKSLEGSRLYLTNVFGTKPSKLHLDLKADTAYDDTVAQVLKVYDVSLPFRQTRGSCQTALTLDVMVRSGETKMQGSVRPSRGSIFQTGNTHVTIHGGKVTWDDSRVTLHALEGSTAWLRARFSGDLNLHKRRADLRADILRLQFGGKKDPFFQMKNKNKLPVHLEWGTGSWRLALPHYKTILNGSQRGFTLTCSSLKPLLPYLRGVPLKLSGGTLRVKTDDGRRYRFSGKVRWPSSYLYDKKGPITLYPFSGTSNGKSTVITALGKRIRYDGGRKLLSLSHLYIDAKKALATASKNKHKTSRLHIKGSNSLIRYDKYVLLTDRFDLKINGKSTTFVASKDGDTVRVDLNGNTIVVKAHRIKAPMLRALIHFGGLTGGRYSLNLQGNIKGNMRGVITIEGGTVSRFKTYNNMIALFNTVPALSTLSDPGFSQKGFEVRNGRIEFRIAKNRIFFDMIYIDGKSAAISGKGTVSMINGAINMDLAVRTAREIGKIIGSLPIVGYILMGKDKSITTGVKVTGTLENPKVTTHVVMETLLAPFEMMVRTLKSPAHIINK